MQCENFVTIFKAVWLVRPDALQLTVILCTFRAPDYVFTQTAIFHFNSDQYVLKCSVCINLNIGNFSQCLYHFVLPVNK